MSFKNQLAKAKAKWKKSAEMKPDYGSDVPDGAYHVRVIQAELKESQKGNLMVAWRAVVLEGESKGENISWYSQLVTEENMMYFRRDISKLGFEPPEDISEVEDLLTDIQKKKPSMKVSLKTNGDFQNVRLGKLLTGEDVPEDDEVPAEEPEEPEEEEAPAEEPEAEPEEAVANVGDRVAFDLKGKEVVGTISKLDPDTDEAIVKLDETGKSYRIKGEKLKPAPKTKVKKK